ncbi:MAG: invasion associated locus B family protein [Acetobacteraceae bacterium]|nr:invasion associated locus B family protein [Acetobacteraceae bacterium]
MQRAVLILALAAVCGPALAQRSRAQTPPSTAPAPAQTTAPAPSGNATPPAPAANEPQRTTATFGDWILSCLHPERAAVTCEVSQFLTDKGQPVAQTVFSRPRAGEPLRLAVAVPVNVSLLTQPRLAGTESEETTFPPIYLAWQRCVPRVCIADTTLTEDQLKRLRSRTDNARVLFHDAAGREAALPFGPRGLSQALDALAKEG